MILQVMMAFVACFFIASSVWAGTCATFHLKTDKGEQINPITGENADQPYSTRQSCGSCHDYSKISDGYHFQMGWAKANDGFSNKYPWVLSPGMTGKF